MKGLLLLCISISLYCKTYSQKATSLITIGDQSPSAIANNIKLNYGVPVAVTVQLLSIYEKRGYNKSVRYNKVLTLINEYKKLNTSRDSSLTTPLKKKLGILGDDAITSALNYDLFLSTAGAQSPAIYAEGNVEIWYGLPELTFKNLWLLLEKNKAVSENMVAKLNQSVAKIKELEKALRVKGDNSSLAKQARILMNKGELEKAEQLLTQDYAIDMKRVASKAYNLALLREAINKYFEATELYKFALATDPDNLKCLLKLVKNYIVTFRIDSAIATSVTSIGIFEKRKLNNPEDFIELLDITANLMVIENKNTDEAIFYQKKAIDLSRNLSKENYKPERYKLLSELYFNKNMPDSGRLYKDTVINLITAYFDKQSNVNQKQSAHTLPISTLTRLEKRLKLHGNESLTAISLYQKLSDELIERNQYDSALIYALTPLESVKKIFGESLITGAQYRIIGRAYQHTDRFDSSLYYLRKALQIMTTSNQQNERIIAIYGDIGLTHDYMNNFDSAIYYHQLAISILKSIPNFNKSSMRILNSNLSRALNNFGLHSFKEGKVEDAYCLFTQALSANLKTDDENTTVNIYFNLGSSLQELGHFNHALKYLNKANTYISDINNTKEDSSLLRYKKYFTEEKWKELHARQDFSYIQNKITYQKAICYLHQNQKDSVERLELEISSFTKQCKDTTFLTQLEGMCSYLNTYKRNTFDNYSDSFSVENFNEHSIDTSIDGKNVMLYSAKLLVKNICNSALQVTIRIPYGYYDGDYTDEYNLVAHGFSNNTLLLEKQKAQEITISKQFEKSVLQDQTMKRQTRGLLLVKAQKPKN